ncbi:TetR/AcrR family transcriptional regulator [Pseudoalteromonas sp. PS5]|uniref:TetR/AcrR family transcriptional regulator n=1 Tax=Pseudoalteromonas sp. PS5 TaxID=1437473 RepID=UPI000FFECD59|nr:TetR/AcrR family transcriptional regulator [Pseudoalteromonas sp. PS5]RXE96052.1 TetR/AcrR family transcriptional regulator [Pseudoalteromonas sp. PS5]
MKKREITYKKILESGWLLFQQKGFEETTTRQIAQQAGVATGTVFAHFPTKLEILKVAMYEQIEQLIAQAQKSDTQHSASLKLRHYAKYLFAFYLDNRAFSKELITGIIWQSHFFSVQLDLFKQLLFSEQEYDELKASVMMDCYFMTVIEGLNDEASSVDDLIYRLSQKLKLISNQSV